MTARDAISRRISVEPPVPSPQPDRAPLHGREARVRNPSLSPGNAELKAVGDPPRAVDEMAGRLRRAELVGRGFEERDPAVEMLGRDRQLEMNLHRRTVIAPGHQRHRRPERAQFRDMRLPIRDPRREDRPDQGIGLHAGIEGPHQALDHRVVDPGRRHQLRCDAGAALGGVFGVVCDGHG
jgi:hypothetical protein